jgi:hypothetical protein
MLLRFKIYKTTSIKSYSFIEHFQKHRKACPNFLKKFNFDLIEFLNDKIIQYSNTIAP